MEHTWKVWKDNREVGYIRDPSELGATAKALKEFGNNTWIERIPSCK